MTDLSNVSIGIKTFLRDAMLYKTIADIIDTMPEVRIVIADDGNSNWEKTGLYNGLRARGDCVIQMPFDSGFGAKSNAIAGRLERKYLLIGSDDFDFSSARPGIEKLVETLDNYPNIDIASGRVNNNPYEFILMDSGDEVRELRVYPDKYMLICDLTVNYSLMRASVLKKVKWDDDVKIGGGEHGAFFVDCKRAGIVTAYVPGVGIREQTNARPDIDYFNYRRRALSPERPCFDRRGIKRYILGSGQVDYDYYKATSRS